MLKSIKSVRSMGMSKFRLTAYFISYSHLLIMSIKLLNMDFEQSDDPNLRIYSKLKWKLITTWFNLLAMPYIPLCMYIDWRDIKNDKSELLQFLKKLRDFVFSNLILPATVFADILFWRLWNHDKELIMPNSTHKMVSYYEQHCMHTVSLVFVIFDLLTIKRERPKNMTPGIIAMMTFLYIYLAVCMHSLLNQEYIYPLFKTLSKFKFFVLVVYTTISFFFYYFTQWLIVDYVHGPKSLFNKKKL